MMQIFQVWGTQRWEHRLFASIFGIIESNAYLAYKYFKQNSSILHSDFTEALALQLIRNRWCTNERNEAALVESNNNDVPNRVAQNADNGNIHRALLLEQHTLISLSSEDDRDRTRVQRKCIICSRVRKVQQKANYRCSACGPRSVMCAPTTGRDCFCYHIQNGIPA